MKFYPFTSLLSIFVVLGFIGDLLGISHALAFWGWESISRPWTVLTHPFAFFAPPGFAFLSALFAFLTIWLIGRSLEGRWKSWGWALFFILATLATSAWSLVMSLMGVTPVILSDPWIILGGAIMLWAWENPELPLLAYGLLPMKAIYLAWIYVGFNFFLLFSSGLPTACTTLIPVGVAWLWRSSLQRGRGQSPLRQRKTKNRSYLKRVK